VTTQNQTELGVPHFWPGLPEVGILKRAIPYGNPIHPSVILDTSLKLSPCQNDLMPSDAHPDFDALTRQHKDAVYRQMLRACGNHHDAEDVLIEALLKAYRHLNQLRDSAAFRAWLAQIARRVCWQLKEREALLPLLQLSTLEEEGRELPADDPTPETSLARRQMKQFLDDAIAALPDLYRVVYTLRDIEDLPGDEVARKLGISRAAMKSRLHRARDLVRTRLDAALTHAGSREQSPETIQEPRSGERIKPTA
jgi:RNA polymerase sigma-70 factor (ECF subfamily)